MPPIMEPSAEDPGVKKSKKRKVAEAQAVQAQAAEADAAPATPAGALSLALDLCQSASNLQRHPLKAQACQGGGSVGTNCNRADGGTTAAPQHSRHVGCSCLHICRCAGCRLQLPSARSPQCTFTC